MSKVWNNWENVYIIQNAGILTDEELAIYLSGRTGRNITRAALRKHRQRLKIAKICGRGKCGLVKDDSDKWLTLEQRYAQHPIKTPPLFNIFDNHWFPKKTDSSGITTNVWFYSKYTLGAIYAIGLKFQYCKVVDYHGRRPSGAILWKCKCINKHNGNICGKFFNAGLSELKSGNTKSCGCYRKKQSALRQQNSCPINHNYFDELNCEKAQTMGFIAADGTLLYINKNTTQCGNGSWRCGVKLAEIEPPPFVEKKLVLGYINGYFEGDGSLIWCNRSQRWRVNFAGHRTTLEWIAEQLYEFNIVNTIQNIHSKSPHSKMYSLTYGRQTDVISFINIMRQLNVCGKHIYTMDRKWFSQKYFEHRNKIQRYSKVVIKDEEKFYII